jgi:L-alanine-DL-glutamate epimerase-like enolase superfamily enzyme
MKNRKREIRTSGSVRDEDGQHPHLLGRRSFLHLAASAAALPAVSRIAIALPDLPIAHMAMPLYKLFTRFRPRCWTELHQENAALVSSPADWILEAYPLVSGASGHWTAYLCWSRCLCR